MIDLHVFVQTILHDLRFVLLGGAAGLGVIIALWVAIGIARLMGESQKDRWR